MQVLLLPILLLRPLTSHFHHLIYTFPSPPRNLSKSLIIFLFYCSSSTKSSHSLLITSSHTSSRFLQIPWSKNHIQVPGAGACEAKGDWKEDIDGDKDGGMLILTLMNSSVPRGGFSGRISTCGSKSDSQRLNVVRFAIGCHFVLCSGTPIWF